MHTAQEILKNLIKKSPGLRKRLGGLQAAENWGVVADPDRKSWVIDINSGILRVATEDPSFGQELHFNKKKIIDGLNLMAGEKAIKDIKIKIGSRE